MYNTNYKCVKPLTLWYDGPDGKKKPYRVERGTIWHLDKIEIIRTVRQLVVAT